MVREFLHRRAIRRAQNIISISPYVKDYMRNWVRGSIWSIANPIEEAFFEIEPAVCRGLRMICVGTVGERKNQQLLVEACALMAQRGSEFECRVIGEVAARSRVPALVADKKLGGKVKITGAISAEALLEHYRWANVVVLPSRGETSPLSLIQAMAAERCVFGAAAARTPALLRNGELGTLFSPDDANELCSKLLNFHERPQRYWQLAGAATAYARSNFRVSSVAGATIELYRQIAAKGSSGDFATGKITARRSG